MGHRAEVLAARVREGAAGLAAFVRDLSDKEWATKVPGSGRDNRTVGVVVHHVASVYPIEIQLAKTIGSGKAVDVTWEAVAEMNAGHAKENADISREAALELLQKNSREAADAVAGFTDEELDRAAPFGLAFGAPMTAQFVLEDHAVRHSWHHLARIKAALGRK